MKIDFLLRMGNHRDSYCLQGDSQKKLIYTRINYPLVDGNVEKVLFLKKFG